MAIGFAKLVLRAVVAGIALATVACAAARADEVAKQPLYLFTQTSKGDGSRPIVLQGCCANRDVTSPGSEDALTKFTDARAAVLHQINERGVVIRTQNLADAVAIGNVRLSGAADTVSPGLFGFANVVVTIVRPEPGVTYKVEVRKGVVVSRNNDKADAKERAGRLAEFSKAIELAESELAEIATAIGPDSPAYQLLKVHVQLEVVWAATNDNTAPGAAESSTKRFVEGLLSLVSGESKDVNSVMAMLLAGQAPLTDGAREYFLRKRALLAEPQESKIHDVVGAALKDWWEGRGRATLLFGHLFNLPMLATIDTIRKDVAVILSAADKNADFARAIERMRRPTLVRFLAAKHLFDELANPSVVKVAMSDGSFQFGELGIDRALDASKLPNEWKALLPPNAVFDVSGVPAGNRRTMMEKITLLERAHRVNVSRRFIAEPNDAAWPGRLEGLLDIGELDLHVGLASIEKNPGAAPAFALLQLLKPKLEGLGGFGLQVLHAQDGHVKALIDNAKTFAGKHEAFILCHRPRSAILLDELRAAAFKAKTKSVWMPTTIVDPRAAAMLGLVLVKYPDLLDATTPEIGIAKACDRALSLLGKAEKTLKAIEDEFKDIGLGQEAANLFRVEKEVKEGGAVDKRAIKETRDSLRDMRDLSMLFLSENKSKTRRIDASLARTSHFSGPQTARHAFRYALAA